ncbi:MAG: amino acid permease [Candidatus Poseidoniales archaeon]|nr:amino acid permease [Candidatus Poseidoniales archaeon]
MQPIKPSMLIDFVYRPIELVSNTLERNLGVVSVVIISLSAMLGSGLFVLPALAMLDMGGPGIWLAYVVAALVVLPGAISKSELATAMPTSGGSYVFIERTYGPLLGTISGLGLWATFLLKAAFALIGFKAYLWVFEDLFGIPIDVEIAALILLVVIVGINIMGVKKIKKIQAPIVTAAVGFLVIISIWALLTMEMDWNRPIGKDAYPGGWESVAGTAALVFVSYSGVTKIAAIAEEIKQPSKNIPSGILISLLISTLLYAGIAYIMMAAVDPVSYETTSGGAREDPIYVFANAVGGKVVGIIAAVLAVITMTSMALAGIMAASRYPFAMARDNLLPEPLENVHPKYETPHLAIFGTGLAMAVSILVLPVHDVAKLASGFQIMIFIIINAAVIVLRRAATTHYWYNPEWKSPLFPFFQIMGIIGGSTLVYLMGEKAIIGAAVCCAIGLVTYYSYGKSRAHPKLTPWRTVRTEFTNTDQHDREKRWLVFHTAADKSHPDHLTEGEFVNAMRILAPHYDAFHVRNMFHEIDINGNGIIDVDEFLQGIEDSFDEQE